MLFEAGESFLMIHEYLELRILLCIVGTASYEVCLSSVMLVMTSASVLLLFLIWLSSKAVQVWQRYEAVIVRRSCCLVLYHSI